MHCLQHRQTEALVAGRERHQVGIGEQAHEFALLDPSEVPDERSVRVGLGDAGGDIVGSEPGPTRQNEHDIGNRTTHLHHRVDERGVVLVRVGHRREKHNRPVTEVVGVTLARHGTTTQRRAHHSQPFRVDAEPLADPIGDPLGRGEDEVALLRGSRE